MRTLLLLALIFPGCANMTEQQRTDALTTAERLVLLAHGNPPAFDMSCILADGARHQRSDIPQFRLHVESGTGRFERALSGGRSPITATLAEVEFLIAPVEL